jgi:hypothetical protein
LRTVIARRSEVVMVKLGSMGASGSWRYCFPTIQLLQQPAPKIYSMKRLEQQSADCY